MKTVMQVQFNVNPRKARLSVNALAITVFFAALFTFPMPSHATQETPYKVDRTA